jgi:hypothetical protein
MTPLQILSPEEIETFENPPFFTAQERKYYFSLPAWAKTQLSKLESPVSKIGFMLQLGYFRATKKFYPKASFPTEDAEFVQQRLGLEEH